MRSTHLSVESVLTSEMDVEHVRSRGDLLRLDQRDQTSHALSLVHLIGDESLGFGSLRET